MSPAARRHIPADFISNKKYKKILDKVYRWLETHPDADSHEIEGYIMTLCFTMQINATGQQVIDKMIADGYLLWT